MPIPAQFVIPDSAWIHRLGGLGLIKLGVVLLGLVVTPDSVWRWIHGLGGLGLILLGLADNTPFVSAPPGSMDLVVILLSAARREWWAYYALMATIGEVLGGYLTYRLSEKGGEATFERKVGRARAARTYRLFERYGASAVLAGSILPPPFPFTSVLMAAGVMHFPRKKFFSALVAGRAVRFFAVAFFARMYAQRMIALFAQYYHPMLVALIALAVAGAIGGLAYSLYRARQRRRSSMDRMAKEGHGAKCGEADQDEAEDGVDNAEADGADAARNEIDKHDQPGKPGGHAGSYHQKPPNGGFRSHDRDGKGHPARSDADPVEDG